MIGILNLSNARRHCHRAPKNFFLQNQLKARFVWLYQRRAGFFAGAAFQLQSHGLTHVFVSGVTHGRMEVGQRQQMSLLQNAYDSDIDIYQFGMV